jgi:polar amino acid transport system substrate-binding protein
LLGKAMARPDLVKKVLAKARSEGLWKAWQTASDRLDQPTPLGYSCAGQVLETGGEVDGLCRGDWVACGGDTANHAEVVCVPKNLVTPIPEGVGTESAAFATLGAIAMQGVRLAEARLGENVAVIGLGLIGLLTVQLLKASGCRVLGIDVDPARLALAGELGCETTVHAGDDSLVDQVLLFTGGYGVDATVITAGTSSNQPVEQAGEITREKGRVIVIGATGLQLPRGPYYHKEISFQISRSYGPGRYDPGYEQDGHDYPYGYVRFTERRNMACFLDLVKSGRVALSKIITHRFAIDDAATAYQLISGERPEPYLGILLEYPRQEQEIARRIELAPRPAGNGKITVGVIGAGNYATSYLLPAIRDHALLRLGGLCTGSGVSAAQIGQKFGFECADADVDGVIERSDAVLVATRHDEHARYAIEALRKGKAVFVEKPLAITEEQLDEVIACLASSNSQLSTLNSQLSCCNSQLSCRNSQLSLMVGFNRRFAPATLLVKEHFAAAKGPKQILIRINAGSLPAGHWMHKSGVGGGRLVGEGCHFVDLAVALTGSVVKRVQAMAIPQPELDQALWEDFSIQLAMADGSVATVVYTALGDSAMPKERVEVSGGGRSALIEDFREVQLWHRGKRKCKTWSRQDKGQRAEIDCWAKGLRDGTCPMPFEEIANVHRACLGAIRSLSENAAVLV